MAIEKVVNLKVNDDIQDTTKNVVGLKTQLREAVGEVQRLSDEFGATSKQAVEAAKRAADLKDRIEDANDAIQAFKGEGAFLATAKSLGAVSGGFTALQGAMSLAGGESENVEKAILKVQSAMAITQGLESIEDAGRSFKQLGAVIRSTTIFQKALSAATAIQTFVMNGATLAAKALRGALIATGVGALVVGVGLLIANFDKVKKVVMNLVPALSIVGDVVMSIVNTVTDFIGVTSDASRSLDKMVSDSQKTLRKNQDFLDTQGDKYDDYTKRKIQANIDYAAKVKEVADDETRTEEEKLIYLKALRDKADRDIAQADKDRQAERDKKAKEEQDKIDAKNKEARDKRKEERDRLKKEAQDIADNAKKANEEISKTDLERLTEKYKKELAILKKQQVSTLDLEIKFLNDKNDLSLKQQEIDYKLAEEKKAKEEKDAKDKKEKDEENAKEQIAREQKVAEDLIRFEDDKNKVLASSKENLNNIISGLESSGLAKTKAGQVASKAIALTQIAIDSAVALSKASTLANAEGVAAQLAFPTLPGAGTVARVISYASTALSVASNITRAKALLSSGGSGSVSGSSPSGGSGGGQAPAPPQFNIVGQSGTNQLAQTIAGQQNKPIEAFVVSSAVTTSQALDRNRVKTATFGG
jgi:hypothetical protein